MRNTATYADQATYQILLVDEMRKYAIEYSEIGGIELTSVTMHRLAYENNIHFSKKFLKDMFSCWASDSLTNKAFLREIDKNVYCLSEHYINEHNFLLEAGKTSIEARSRAYLRYNK